MPSLFTALVTVVEVSAVHSTLPTQGLICIKSELHDQHLLLITISSTKMSKDLYSIYALSSMVPSAMDALDDLVIEYEDSLVDLSNLISSSKKPRFSDRESGRSKKHEPPVTRQERIFSSLYPSREEAEALEVVNASDILAKCCVRDHSKARASEGLEEEE
jgi:hypothetical protein